MKNYMIFILILCVLLISGCANPEVPVSRQPPENNTLWWGTADIKAQVLTTSFPANNGLVLKVLEINDYFLDGGPEQSLFEGDEISVLVKGEWKSQLVCEPVEPPEEWVGPNGDIYMGEIHKNWYISCHQIEETGIIECEQCTKDESINRFEGWNAMDLERRDTINMMVRRGGYSYTDSAWFTDDLTISLIE